LISAKAQVNMANASGMLKMKHRVGWLVGWLVGDKVFFKDVCTFFGWWPLLGF